MFRLVPQKSCLADAGKKVKEHDSKNQCSALVKFFRRSLFFTGYLPSKQIAFNMHSQYISANTMFNGIEHIPKPFT
jgi:hypothetical protein